MISPEIWDEIFAPLYKDMIDYAHSPGMDSWFHSCENFTKIVERIHNIGVDVINISPPDCKDLNYVSEKLQGKQCFMLPIDYQNTSISGAPETIYEVAQKQYDLLWDRNSGYIGCLEEYSCMGMSEENYQACKNCFRVLKLKK